MYWAETDEKCQCTAFQANNDAIWQDSFHIQAEIECKVEFDRPEFFEFLRATEYTHPEANGNSKNNDLN